MNDINQQPNQESPQSRRQSSGSSGGSGFVTLLVVVIVLLLGVVGYATFTNATGTLGAFNLSGAVDNNQPVAIVNGQEITRDQYQANLAEAQRNYEQQGIDTSASTTQAQIKEQVITGLVNRELILQAAAKEDVSVSDEEIQSTYDQYVQQFGSEEELKAQLASTSDLTPSEFRTELRRQLTIQKFIDAESSEADSGVSDEEIQQTYDQLSAGSTSTPPLSDIEPQLRQRLQQQKQQQVINSLIQELRANAEIEILI